MDFFCGAFERNSTTELEAKLTEKLNDVVKALTKSMADRNDTRKNFRILDKQVKNLFEIIMFISQQPSPNHT